jgi:hypothetical protein
VLVDVLDTGVASAPRRPVDHMLARGLARRAARQGSLT